LFKFIDKFVNQLRVVALWPFISINSSFITSGCSGSLWHFRCSWWILLIKSSQIVSANGILHQCIGWNILAIWSEWRWKFQWWKRWWLSV